jgi:hypothetical protein
MKHDLADEVKAITIAGAFILLPLIAIVVTYFILKP